MIDALPNCCFYCPIRAWKARLAHKVLPTPCYDNGLHSPSVLEHRRSRRTEDLSYCQLCCQMSSVHEGRIGRVFSIGCACAHFSLLCRDEPTALYMLRQVWKIVKSRAQRFRLQGSMVCPET